MCCKCTAIGSDFILNTTVPNFSYRPNNTLNNIIFYPITTFSNSLIQGDKTIRIKLRLALHTASFQIKDKRFQTATVTVKDTTGFIQCSKFLIMHLYIAGNISLKRATYSVLENQVHVRVCAVLNGGYLDSSLRILPVITAVTAYSGSKIYYTK